MQSNILSSFTKTTPIPTLNPPSIQNSPPSQSNEQNPSLFQSNEQNSPPTQANEQNPPHHASEQHYALSHDSPQNQDGQSHPRIYGERLSEFDIANLPQDLGTRRRITDFHKKEGLVNLKKISSLKCLWLKKASI